MSHHLEVKEPTFILAGFGMTPREVLMAACADGVRLIVSDRRSVIAHWHSKENRTRWELLLKDNWQAITPLILQAKQSWRSDSELIRAWLARIGEQDQQAVADVLDNCRDNLHVRDYFMTLGQEDAKGVVWPDDRVRCRECLHLTYLGACLLACPAGPVVAMKGYKPVEMAHRCPSFKRKG